MPLIPVHPKEFLKFSYKLNAMLNIYFDRVLSEPVHLTCPSAAYNRLDSSIRNNPLAKKVLIGKTFKPRREQYIGKVAAQDIKGLDLAEKGVLQANYEEKGSTNF